MSARQPDSEPGRNFLITFRIFGFQRAEETISTKRQLIVFYGHQSNRNASAKRLAKTLDAAEFAGSECDGSDK